MTYHPTTNPTDLPPVTDVASLDRLPWGGNAWWDLPIIRHTDAFGLDETKPRELRQAVTERAGFLMTGENCTFNDDYSFDDWLRDTRG